MKILTFFLFIVFLAVSVQAQEVKGLGEVGGVEVSAKIDRPLDVGVELSADPNIHEAIYKVLEKKGIKCDGLSTKKDGTVTIINPSSNKPLITADEIGKELTKIKQTQDIEAKIQAEIRAMAIKSLKQKGEIPQDYKRRSDF